MKIHEKKTPKCKYLVSYKKTIFPRYFLITTSVLRNKQLLLCIKNINNL